MIDVKKFSSELVDELGHRFPSMSSEDGELSNRVISTIAVVVAIAIEKYEKEQSR